MIKGIIFDKDGTIIDTEPLHLRMWVEELKNQGYPATDDILFECIGLNYPSMNVLLKGYFGDGFEIEPFIPVVNEKVRIYELENGIPLKKGFIELSDYLREKNIRCAVATSSMHDEAVFCLTHLDIIDRFDVIIGGDEIDNGKPAPDIFIKAREALGFEADECIILEDSENGVKAALASGSQCVWIPDMKEIPTELIDRTIRLNSLDEVINIIERKN